MHSQSLMFEMGLLRQCRERVARHRWWASFHCLTEAMGKEFNYSSVHFGEKSHWHWTSDKRQTDSDGLSAYVWQENYRWPVAIKCRCAFMYRHASSTLLIVEAFLHKKCRNHLNVWHTGFKLDKRAHMLWNVCLQAIYSEGRFQFRVRPYSV